MPIQSFNNHPTKQLNTKIDEITILESSEKPTAT